MRRRRKAGCIPYRTKARSCALKVLKSCFEEVFRVHPATSQCCTDNLDLTVAHIVAWLLCLFCSSHPGKPAHVLPALSYNRATFWNPIYLESILRGCPVLCRCHRPLRQHRLHPLPHHLLAVRAGAPRRLHRHRPHHHRPAGASACSSERLPGIAR